MTTIKINRKRREVEAKGHAKLAVETGEDIVCAAVSTALKTTVKTCNHLKIDYTIGIDNGYLYLRLRPASKQAIAVFDGLVETLGEISEEFPANANMVLTEEVIVESTVANSEEIQELNKPLN